MSQSEAETVNILIVDDRPENIISLEALLKSDHVNLISTTSPNEALKLCWENEISIALVDVQMPEMDGFELVEILKSNPKTKDILVVFVTAISKETKYVIKGLDSGAIDYLYKPLDPYVTTSKLNSLLAIARAQREIKQKNSELEHSQKQLIAAIERYDMIAEATSDTIWDWDIPNDKILYNEGITNLFGYEKTKIKNIEDWWKTKTHPDDLQIVLEAVAAAFKKQSYNLQLEYRFRCADESFKYIYNRAFVIYDEHKKPCRMIGAMQDVSKLKENEISLIELNENLQKQTKELSISNEELEGRNQVLQDIAWTQSHIVRAPLARMMGIVSIIRDLRVESPDYEEWINHFTTSANELDNIIKVIVNKSIRINHEPK